MWDKSLRQSSIGISHIFMGFSLNPHSFLDPETDPQTISHIRSIRKSNSWISTSRTEITYYTILIPPLHLNIQQNVPPIITLIVLVLLLTNSFLLIHDISRKSPTIIVHNLNYLKLANLNSYGIINSSCYLVLQPSRSIEMVNLNAHSHRISTQLLTNTLKLLNQFTSSYGLLANS